MKAYYELLEECSQKLTGGQKTFNSVFTFDGKMITSLADIPINCKILLCSEQKFEEPASESPDK
jgi:hypothetical protein